jgi:hypothetical protein
MAKETRRRWKNHGSIVLPPASLSTLLSLTVREFYIMFVTRVFTRRNREREKYRDYREKRIERKRQMKERVSERERGRGKRRK